MRFRRRLGGVWGGLGRVLRRPGKSVDSNVVRPGSGLAECASAVEDFVFEEEESEEV